MNSEEIRGQWEAVALWKETRGPRVRRGSRIISRGRPSLAKRGRKGTLGKVRQVEGRQLSNESSLSLCALAL